MLAADMAVCPDQKEAFASLLYLSPSGAFGLYTKGRFLFTSSFVSAVRPVVSAKVSIQIGVTVFQSLRMFLSMYRKAGLTIAEICSTSLEILAPLL